ncbi:hypothetical protein BKA69DRAFT_288036 [Paraphysoderma sedebokerense]|nr:hypothetical protein BKA69DRAFT_288036 [Paraphysoderma sedebokerense]
MRLFIAFLILCNLILVPSQGLDRPSPSTPGEVGKASPTIVTIGPAPPLPITDNPAHPSSKAPERVETVVTAIPEAPPVVVVVPGAPAPARPGDSFETTVTVVTIKPKPVATEFYIPTPTGRSSEGTKTSPFMQSLLFGAVVGIAIPLGLLGLLQPLV